MPLAHLRKSLILPGYLPRGILPPFLFSAQLPDVHQLVVLVYELSTEIIDVVRNFVAHPALPS